MKGKYERYLECVIEEGKEEIAINWINMSEREAASGGADRCTELLLAAGYRPDGRYAAEAVRQQYINGEKVNGKFVRMPQEEWKKVR